MSVFAAMSVAMGSGLMVASSSGKVNPGELQKVESLEVLSNWQFVRGAKPYGLNRLIGADTIFERSHMYCHLCEDMKTYFAFSGRCLEF